MTEKIYYTLEEVHTYLDTLDERYSSERKINRDVFEIFGFECIYNFCLTQNGWVASHEDCCSYCVHCIIDSYGTKEDKALFNNNHDLGNKYNIPMTRKERAIKEKARRKSKKNNFFGIKRNRDYDWINAKKLNKSLKDIKSANISILGRGKKNLWDDIFRYSNNPEEFIYIKDLKAMLFIPCISEGEDVYKYLIDEIEHQNERFGLSIIKPTRDILKRT